MIGYRVIYIERETDGLIDGERGKEKRHIERERDRERDRKTKRER